MKKASIRYILFKLNYGYHLYICYKKCVDSCSRSKTIDVLTKKHGNLMTTYRKNLKHAQKLLKQAYNKGTKPRSYVFSETIWLNIKYIKTKYN